VQPNLLIGGTASRPIGQSGRMVDGCAGKLQSLEPIAQRGVNVAHRTDRGGHSNVQPSGHLVPRSCGSIVQSQGVAAGDTFKAEMLENAAQRGQVASVEVGAGMSRKLASGRQHRGEGRERIYRAMRLTGAEEPSAPSARPAGAAAGASGWEW
jgi:hypothetical protein